MRVSGIDSDKFVTFAKFKFAKDSQISALAPLLADASFLDELNEWQSAAIENGEFQVVQFDDRVVDTSPKKGGKQMLGRGN